MNDYQTEHALDKNKDPDTMLRKLMDNIRNNVHFRNKNIRAMFKLDEINEEQDLHKYKNLLNAMAALFYTNHADVSAPFQQWRQVFL